MTYQVPAVSFKPVNSSFGRNIALICDEWDLVKNNELSIDSQDIDPHSRISVHWRCLEHGHEWVDTIYSRTVWHAKCPVCAGRELLVGFNDFATKGSKNLVAEWHPTKNFGVVSPQSILYNSDVSVHWKCQAHGHEWKQKLRNRTWGSSTGCPVCAGTKVLAGYNDVGSLAGYEKIVTECHPSKNNKKTPQNTAYGFTGRLWFQCAEDPMHEWSSTLSSRIAGSGCLICAAEKDKNDLVEALFKQTRLIFAPKMIDVNANVINPEVYENGILTVESDLYNDKLNLIIMFDDQYTHGHNSPYKRGYMNVLGDDVSQTVDLLNAGYKIIRIRETSRESSLTQISQGYMKRALNNYKLSSVQADNYYSVSYKPFSKKESIENIVEKIIKRRSAWFS